MPVPLSTTIACGPPAGRTSSAFSTNCRPIYAGDKGTVLRGVLAERRIGPLSGNPVYRVTDTHQEARDLDAGVWIGINDVIRFQE